MSIKKCPFVGKSVPSGEMPDGCFNEACRFFMDRKCIILDNQKRLDELEAKVNRLHGTLIGYMNAKDGPHS